MKKLSPFLFLLFLVFGIFTIPVTAENEKSDTSTTPDALAKYDVPLDLGTETGSISISLAEAIDLAVKNNLGVEGYRYEVKSAKEALNIEDAAFDRLFFAKIPIKREKSAGAVGDTYTSNIGYTIGLSQRFRTGTYVSLQLTDDYTKMNFPSRRDRGTILLSLSQPLLRNFGRRVNTAAFEVAMNQHEISRLELENQVNTLIFDVTSAYWNLALSRDKLDVAKQGKELAIELYKTTENLVKSGAETRLALLRAESGVAVREESVHLATMAAMANQDNLKRLLNLNRNGSIPDTRIELKDKPSRDDVPTEFDQYINYALSNRPDLRAARVGLAMRKISLDVAKNHLKPKLDLTAAIALTGLDEDYGEHFEEMLKGDYYSFQIGFNIEIPLGNRKARASLRKAEHDFTQTKIKILTAEQGVIFQVRNAIRTVRTNYRRIQSAEVAAALAERSLREEEARYRVGRSTPIEVLRFQTDLIAAQNSELQAIIDYNLAIAELNKVRGANMMKNKLDLDSILEPSLPVPQWESEDSFSPLYK